MTTPEQLLATEPATQPSATTPEQWFERLVNWAAEKEALSQQVKDEREVRRELFYHYFLSPKEGTNNVPLPDGRVLSGKYPIEREVDEASLQGMCKATVGECRPLLQELNLPHAEVPDDMPLIAFMRFPMDMLVRYKPSLSVTAYKAMTAEQQKIFDMCLVIKPGSVAMEIKAAPTRGRKAA